LVNIGRSNLTFWTVSTPAPSCRWARNNPSQRCAKRSQNSRSFLSCASAASFLHCWTWSWKKSDVSSIAITTTKAPLTGASTNQKRSGPVFVPKEKAAPSGRPSSRLAIRGPARALPAIADRCRSTASRFLANQARPGAHRRGYLGPQTPGGESLWRGVASACVVYLPLTIQAYGSAHGRRRSAPALPVLRLADAVQAPTFKRRFGFRLSQL